MGRPYGKHNWSNETKQTAAELADLKEQLKTAQGEDVAILTDRVRRKEKYQLRLADIQNFQNQLELQVRQNTTGLKNINAEITLVSAKGSLDNQRFHRLNEELGKFWEFDGSSGCDERSQWPGWLINCAVDIKIFGGKNGVDQYKTHFSTHHQLINTTVVANLSGKSLRRKNYAQRTQ